MEDWFKNHWMLVGMAALIVIVLYYKVWVPHEQKVNGYTVVDSWDCPSDYPVKANLNSMIYHLPGDPYYARTDARNGECFDGSDHAIEQGFRGIFR